MPVFAQSVLLFSYLNIWLASVAKAEASVVRVCLAIHAYYWTHSALAWRHCDKRLVFLCNKAISHEDVSWYR